MKVAMRVAMKDASSLSARHRLAVLAAAFGAAMLAAPVAHAFTIDNQANTNSDGSARYTDPDSRFSNSGSGGTTIRQGNTTIQFGGQQGSFDQRYNPNRMFDPLGRPGDDR
jgi:hypothetical protein